ncbi:MAG TPA: DUF1707 domain-containing protein, partial [Solirubrobacteraceae bacterium]|nr:DUF1707 domain-containing protein [Solirubrobacteraceae bacterium]
MPKLTRYEPLAVAGLELYVVNFSMRLPAWWLGLVAAMAGIGALALLVAARGLSRSAAVVCERPGGAGDVFDDLPIPGAAWLRRGRWRLGVIGSALAGLAMAVFEAHAEHSAIEGLVRGVTEGMAAAAGFALLAHAVGLLPSRRRPGCPPAVLTAPSTSARTGEAWRDTAPPDLAPGDPERAVAERTVRESYAEGRLTVEELSGRLDLVHQARTAAELR